MVENPVDAANLVKSLGELHSTLTELELPYELRSTDAALRQRDLLRDQLSDYVLPRLQSLEAPLLAVVGGSTGAGKSTLVNSLLRSRVASSSAIRPTTRRPLLLHADGDQAWFDDDRVLGTLARVHLAEDAAPTPPVEKNSPVREVEVRVSSALPAGLALLDAPDVDSVVEDNRNLATQLLASADLWVFVTTAARYADAVPWEHLRAAAARNAVVAVVLDRVPDGAQAEIEADLRNRLSQAGMSEAPIFTIPETALDEQGFLPEHTVAPLKNWLLELGADATARAQVARQTLNGAVESALQHAESLTEETRRQEASRELLVDIATKAYQAAEERFELSTEDGSLLRGEVLARWQEYVGTGEFLRFLESQISRTRDRIGAFLRGKPAPEERVTDAIEDSLANLLISEAQRAQLEIERGWNREAIAPQYLQQAMQLQEDDAQLEEQAAQLIRDWQRSVLDLVRLEGADKRLTARIISFGVNGAGVALMIVVFAQTGGLSGGEVGIAGGTAVLAQRVLEAIFGDQAMRNMAQRARTDLLERAHLLMEQRVAVFTEELPPVDPGSAELQARTSSVRTALGA